MNRMIPLSLGLVASLVLPSHGPARAVEAR